MKTAPSRKCFLSEDEISDHDSCCSFEVVRSGVDNPLLLYFEIRVLILRKEEESQLLGFLKEHGSLEITTDEYNQLICRLQDFKETSKLRHLRIKSRTLLQVLISIYTKRQKRNSLGIKKE